MYSFGVTGYIAISFFCTHSAFKVGVVHVKPSRVSRKPKKRRCVERKPDESGKSDDALEKVDLNDGFVDLKLNHGDLNLNDEVKGKFEECGFENGNMIVDVEIKDGLGVAGKGLVENMGSVKKREGVY
ncbi:hypothetical protein Patl1_29469 [Pistacia atlantica]|uniref:Uncharacterized protein n=1 Tax=Pistacia atlantica TaxID=434234 RepID=A0ACC1AA97_9ROSI|nr:hypothetical protein Patl1_29469 [Pistacia atlantica]